MIGLRKTIAINLERQYDLVKIKLQGSILSGIIEVNRREGCAKGFTTCTLRKLWCGEQRVPDRYSFITEGAQVPVISGDIYEIWEFFEGKPRMSRVIIASHGEFVGPMIFRRIEDRTIFDVVKNAVTERLGGFGSGTFFGTFVIAIIVAIAGLILIEATDLALPVCIIILVLMSMVLSGIAGLIAHSNAKDCGEFQTISVSCDVPDRFYPEEGKL